MTTKNNVYSPCGCGSGKKLKFCCAEVVDEVIKAGRLQQQGQYNMALQALERIEKKHPGMPWTMIAKTSILLETDEPETAYHLIEGLLKEHTKHPLAIALRASSAFNAWGFDVAKPAIYQAFFIGVDSYPHLLSNLANGIAEDLRENQRFLAARQYFGLAMRFSPAEDQQQAYMALMRFDSDEKIPYPFRSVYKLNEYQGTEGQTETIARAEHFSSIGQWQAATLEYEKLVEVDKENSTVWKNLGFCRAWDGQEKEAITALRQAAELTENFDDAVELETVAQLIELYANEDYLDILELEYQPKDLQELISALDFHPRFERNQLSSTDALTEYSILDVLSPGAIEDPEVSLEELPREIGNLIVPVESGSEENDATILITSVENEFPLCREVFEEVAGEFVTLPETEPQVGMTLVKPRYELMTLQTIPEGTSPAIKAIVRRRLIEHKIKEDWSHLPRPALDNLSPTDASSQPEYQKKLTGSIYYLEAICGTILGSISVNELLDHFKLPAPAPLSIDEDQPLHLLSNMQIHRLNLQDLSEDHLRHILDRSRLINHPNFVYSLIEEAISRPEFAENDVNKLQAYLALASICQEKCEFESAVGWIDRGIESIHEDDENAFESVLQLDIKKISLLLYLLDDSQFTEQLQYLRDQYGRKVPQYLEAIEQSLVELLGKPLSVSLTEGLEPVSSSSESK